MASELQTHILEALPADRALQLAGIEVTTNENNVDVIEIQSSIEEYADSERTQRLPSIKALTRNIQYGTGAVVLYAHTQGIDSTETYLCSDVDGVVRKAFCLRNIFSPGKIEEFILDQLSTIDRLGFARVHSIITNNVTDGFAAKLFGMARNYLTQERQIRENLPATLIESAVRVGDKPKQDQRRIDATAQSLIDDIYRAQYDDIAGFLFRKETRQPANPMLISMFGDNPNDEVFFNLVVNKIRELKPELSEQLKFLFVKFPYKIPWFVPKALHKIWQNIT